MKKMLYRLALAVATLSLACSDQSPTKPDTASVTGALQDQGAVARSVHRAPRSVPPRAPIGPAIRLLQSGSWGSPQSTGLDNHLLTVTSTGATLDQECAHGTISQAIVLNATGHFDVAGQYSIQAGPSTPPRPARFAGTVNGQTMTLTVTMTETNQTFGPFTLTFGQQPRIGYCPIV